MRGQGEDGADVAEGTSEITRTLCGPDLSRPDYLMR